MKHRRPTITITDKKNKRCKLKDPLCHLTCIEKKKRKMHKFLPVKICDDKDVMMNKVNVIQKMIYQDKIERTSF